MQLSISVIIPVYNAERFLEKAVNSALQFEEVKEILLVEDASTDNSLEICKNLEKKDNRIQLHRHFDNGNHGAGATRNLGLVKASQDFIAFLDADDYYLSNRFDAEKKLFEDKKTEGVFGAIGTEFISESGENEFKKKFKDTELTTVKHPAEGKSVFYNLLNEPKKFGVFFHLNTLTVKRELIKKYELKFNERLRVHQDFDFNLKLSFYAYLKTGIIDEAIAIRGVHDENRITKIKSYSPIYYKNMLRLYTSLYSWSNKEKLLDSKSRKVIKVKYLTFKIGSEKGLRKWFMMIFHSVLNPDLLKTRYRFHAIGM